MRFDPAIFGLSHIPEKSGLPSVVRGIAVDDFDGACADPTATNAIESKRISRFIADLAVSLIPIYFSKARGAPPPRAAYAEQALCVLPVLPILPNLPHLPSYGCAFSPSIAVNTRRPSGNVTVSPDPLNDPSFARKPWTTT